MIVKVPKGNFEIVQKKTLNLITDHLGAGVAIAFYSKAKETYGLLSYIFPYREYDLQLDDVWLYSGETLLNKVQDELERMSFDWSESKWIIAGASVYKSNPAFLDLAERNLKIAESWLKRLNLWDRIIKWVRISAPLALEIKGREGQFILKIQNRVENYE